MIAGMPELIWIHGLDGTRAQVLHTAEQIEVDRRLQQSETLRFVLRADDPKAGWIGEDVEVVHRDVHYRTTKPQLVRDEKGAALEVESEALWVELVGKLRVGVFTLVAVTRSAGLTAILEDSGWSVGTVEGDGGSLTFEASDQTVLSLVRAWSAICGREVVFDTAARTVSLVIAQGDDNGIGFRYGYNLRTIRRTATAPQATRLYAYGAANLSIASVNPTGLPYVENFDWYTAQGLSLADARALYTKDQIWVDASYLSATDLLDAATARLESLSRPQVTYAATVLDLSAITDWPADAWGLGDVVHVHDEILGLSLDARVVRLVSRPLEPARNEIELEFLRPGIGVPTAQSARSGLTGGSTFSLYVDENPVAQIIGASQITVASFGLNFPGNGNVVIGFELDGVASAATGTVRITTYWGTQQVGEINGGAEVDFAASGRVHVSVPIAVVGLEGSDVLYVKAQVVTGSGTITAQPGQIRTYILVSGALGGGVNTTDRIDINEVVSTVGNLLGTVETVTPTLLTPAAAAPAADDGDANLLGVAETVTVTLT